jgi:hypothetical protein
MPWRFAQGRQQLGEAAQTLVLLRQTIEQFNANIRATRSGAGSGAVARPIRPPIVQDDGKVKFVGKDAMVGWRNP